jgi:hypothetical protein
MTHRYQVVSSLRRYLVFKRWTLLKWMIRTYNTHLLFLTFHLDKTKKMLRFLFRAILLQNLRRVASVGRQALTCYDMRVAKDISGHQEFATSEDVPDASKMRTAVVLEMPAKPKTSPHS